LAVTEGVSKWQKERKKIGEFYKRQADLWLNKAESYSYPMEKNCWKAYFGLHITSLALYNIIQLQYNISDKTEFKRYKRALTVLFERFVPLVYDQRNGTNERNAFFMAIIADGLKICEEQQISLSKKTQETLGEAANWRTMADLALDQLAQLAPGLPWKARHNVAVRWFENLSQCQNSLEQGRETGDTPPGSNHLFQHSQHSVNPSGGEEPYISPGFSILPLLMKSIRSRARERYNNHAQCLHADVLQS